MKNEWLEKFPKIELHCHLDGSLSERALEKIAAGSAEETKLLINKMRVTGDAVDLADYLTCFDNALPFLQTAENLQIAAYELLREVAKEHVIYIEVRFAPMFHGQRGLSQTAAVQAVLAGLEAGLRDFGVNSRLILCMMRGQAKELNQATLDCARMMQGYGVAGVDLAGNEAAYPPELYHHLFAAATKWQLPFTIHAGECGADINVKTAISMGASRIGHGVAIAENDEIKELCRKQGIVLEMCPVSNRQTGAVKSMADYPLERMRLAGVLVTVNTDNRTVSDTTLVREWTVLNQYFGIANPQNLEQAGRRAIAAAFLPTVEKAALQQEFDEKVTAMS